MEVVLLAKWLDWMTTKIKGCGLNPLQWQQFFNPRFKKNQQAIPRQSNNNLQWLLGIADNREK